MKKINFIFCASLLFVCTLSKLYGQDTLSNDSNGMYLDVHSFEISSLNGTFEFIAYSEDCDTIRITEGRFDVKY